MQLTDTDMNERMLEINEELSQLPGIEKFDITFEPADDKGGIKVHLQNKDVKSVFVSWVIGYSDSLAHIVDTFDYPATITPRTINLSTKRLEMAYFNPIGRLVVARIDGDSEEFKVEKKDREKVSLILRERLGNKFKE